MKMVSPPYWLAKMAVQQCCMGDISYEAPPLGALDSFSQISFYSTNVDIIQPSGRIDCWWLFDHFICILDATYVYGYVFGSFQSSFHKFYFHTSSMCYRACNIFLIMHPAELHTIYVHIWYI